MDGSHERPAYDLRHLLQGQTLEVLLDEDEPSGAGDEASSAAPPPVRLAVASMCKEPGDEAFATWLEYHAVEVGVERFYLR